AFIAAEDRRFYQHKGVDERGLIRAFIGNLAQSGRPQGGSTITQQIVKNLLVGEDLTYERKIREMVVASRVEHTLSKDEILELYERPRRDIGFHFVDQVAREAKSIAGLGTITANSYTVRSTIHPLLQRDVEETLQEGLWRYERSASRLQFQGAEANLTAAIRRIEADRKSSDKRP